VTNGFDFDVSKKGQDVLGTKYMPLLKNEQAVKESVLNLLSTEIGSRPMHPDYGINLNRYLFEPIDDITSDLIAYDIQRGLEVYEPRINNVNVEVIPTEEENSYTIYLSFNIVYSNSNETLEIDFQKIR